jgi:hypothetical protein
MRDVVIGAITGYNFDTIRPWVHSLDSSGFTGHKVVICYNIDYVTCDELTKRGYTVFGFQRNEETLSLEYPKKDFSIVVDRFLHIWHFLSKFDDIRYIVATDVKDVIFQTNPSEWLESNFTEGILASQESIRYCDEDWGRNNLIRSFGESIYERYKKEMIHNAGVIAGSRDYFLDLCLNIYLICNGMPGRIDGGGGPDQAAYNLILNSGAYKDCTYSVESEEGWAAQLGTVANSLYKDKTTALCPMMTQDGIVLTQSGKPFTIVHQYDRIPELKSLIEQKFY